MMNLLHHRILDSDSLLAEHFMPHQIEWIQGENQIHQNHKQVVALAEKSVRIGWTYADGFKNVRKRILFPGRDYLFATKDYPSALEYMNQCYKFAEIFDLTRSIKSHGEESISVNRLDEHGRPSAFTEEIKVGIIKFDNGSRIIAFSANPQAMSVYGGDVGLDEFAKHPNAKLLWETAQARVTWNYDLAVWSSHDGEDTLFNQFAQEARAGRGPWNLHFRVTLPDAIRFGLVDRINQVRGTKISPEQFLAGCRARARDEEIFEQSYLCNPLGAQTASIVEWSAIERCRQDYHIDRVHLEADQVLQKFGQLNPNTHEQRRRKICDFIRSSFPSLFTNAVSASAVSPSGAQPPAPAGCLSGPIEKSKFKNLRLGFDVAASGKGNLAAIYIDEAQGNTLSLRALFTARTEDWHFLGSVLYCFLKDLSPIKAAGDESGLGRQICWEAASQFCSRFLKVNFAGKKQDLGFSLMNQLSIAEKRFPRSQQDIAADFFALRKAYTGTRWVFTEGSNSLNPHSHCDIAWAAALATHAHTDCKYKDVWVMVC